MALCAVNRPLPTSSLVLLLGLFWNFVSHAIFEVSIVIVNMYCVLFLFSPMFEFFFFFA